MGATRLHCKKGDTARGTIVRMDFSNLYQQLQDLAILMAIENMQVSNVS
jgi:hypothetical protein